MGSPRGKDISISITSAFLKLCGLWMAASPSEQRARDVMFVYTVGSIFFAVYLQSSNIYLAWGDLHASLYAVCTFITVLMPLVKIFVLFAHRKNLFRLIIHMQRKFLQVDYDDSYERLIFNNWKRLCAFFICVFTFCTQATSFSYIAKPLIVNIGKNESERILPWDMLIGLPLSTTPYYEVTYLIQILATCQVSLGYICFDNCLCMLNLHAACQFRILQYRLANMPGLENESLLTKNEKPDTNSSTYSDKYYNLFINYVRQHQTLIAYCETVNEVFSLIAFVQVLLFSLLICLDSYQVVMANAAFATRLVFLFHIVTCMSQLFMFTFSCDCIVQESASIKSAVYSGPWTGLPMTTSGKSCRRDVMFVINRSQVPCRLSGNGFFIVSLETFTRVLSTAFSYFTLLRHNAETVHD
ncbi:odorant receptor 13a-like isoform X1 [Ceratina calcarata]|uniref:Odorant receptor n=1 Tax=Ceratina calcarata TaxID=156304 RepID=A0AAJ7WFW4_9HYME|nr:odorant receptor 13a-like isoform X1 [Ceratina calcarata]XP_026674949.1 odorant receptor 13a-like isoform X1 [Ceratina calcarata]